MDKLATTRPSKRRQRDDVVGVTSDGVKILRQVSGPRNFTNAQVRDIVKDLAKVIGQRERTPDAAE